MFCDRSQNIKLVFYIFWFHDRRTCINPMEFTSCHVWSAVQRRRYSCGSGRAGQPLTRRSEVQSTGSSSKCPWTTKLPLTVVLAVWQRKCCKLMYCINVSMNGWEAKLYCKVPWVLIETRKAAYKYIYQWPCPCAAPQICQVYTGNDVLHSYYCCKTL